MIITLPDEVLARRQVVQGRLRQQPAAGQADPLQAAGRPQLCHPCVGDPSAGREIQVGQGGEGLGHVSADKIH